MTRSDDRALGRRRFGRIAFAGTDAGASALTQVAIDQALRAVDGLVAFGKTVDMSGRGA